jgi:predicted transcriptional regulator
VDVMLMVNRDRHDIAMEILEKAKSGKKKTVLMTEVGLSYVQSKQYLNTLLDQGLLQSDEDKCFKTTKKGTEYLEKCGECFLCDWHKQKETKQLRRRS